MYLVVQVLEDVSEEHARKTITVEKFPHMPMITAASIHPCKHAVTMKKLSSMMETDSHHITVDRWGLRTSAQLCEATAGPLQRSHQAEAILEDGTLGRRPLQCMLIPWPDAMMGSSQLKLLQHLYIGLHP